MASDTYVHYVKWRPPGRVGGRGGPHARWGESVRP